MIFLQYVHLSNHQALYLKHTQFYTYIKKGTHASNDFPFYPPYTCHFYSIHFSQEKQKCFCPCAFLVRPLFSNIVSST